MTRDIRDVYDASTLERRFRTRATSDTGWAIRRSYLVLDSRSAVAIT